MHFRALRKPKFHGYFQRLISFKKEDTVQDCFEKQIKNFQFVEYFSITLDYQNTLAER